MSFGRIDLKWSELKGKAKQQIKKLQFGHVGLLDSQQDHYESDAHETYRIHKALADKQMSDLHGILKVMADHHEAQDGTQKNISHEPDINKPSS